MGYQSQDAATIRRTYRHHDFTAQQGSNDSLSFPDVWQYQRILSLDGSGSRGLWSLFVLKKLMAKISKIERSKSPIALSSLSSPLYQVIDSSVQHVGAADMYPGSGGQFRPCHYFDYICGSSMGGIIAIMLGVLRLSVDEAIVRAESIYRDLKFTPQSTISFFSCTGAGNTRSSNSGRLETTLMKNLEGSSLQNATGRTRRSRRHSRRVEGDGASLMRTDDGQCRAIVFATHKAKKGVHHPFALRSYDHLETQTSSRDELSNVSIVQVGRASLSERELYESVKIRSAPGTFRDAGLSRINSAMEAYREVCNLHGCKVHCLLSIGADNSRWQGLDSQTFNEKNDSTDPLEAICKYRQFEYQRLGYSAYFPASDDTVKDIEGRADKFCKAHEDTLDKWAMLLVDGRRRRARTVDWTAFAGLRTVPYNEKANEQPSFDVYNR